MSFPNKIIKLILFIQSVSVCAQGLEKNDRLANFDQQMNHAIIQLDFLQKEKGPECVKQFELEKEKISQIIDGLKMRQKSVLEYVTLYILNLHTISKKINGPVTPKLSVEEKENSSKAAAEFMSQEIELLQEIKLQYEGILFLGTKMKKDCFDTKKAIQDPKKSIQNSLNWEKIMEEDFKEYEKYFHNMKD